MDFIQKLKELGVCSGGVEWAKQYRMAQSMWDACHRGDWMLWLCGNLSGEVGSDSRKKLVWTVCQCVKWVLPYITSGDNIPRIAIETAENYCEGRATLEDVRSAAADASVYAAADAADAAVYAVYAAVCAAYAADAAAYAANAAVYAANVAYVAYVAYAVSEQERVLKQCADIVRECYPVCPLEERE